MFELRRLRLLHELSLRGTIADVADALSYSPSTVSHQLAQLEKQAGIALLEPDGRRVRLTAEGRMLAAHAARVLELDEAVRSQLSPTAASAATVRIAVMPTAAEALVPAALGLLADRMPQLRVEMVERAPEEGLFELHTRGFDLVVAEQYPGHTRELRDGIDRTLLGLDPIRLALPPDAAAVSLAELHDRAWVLEPEGTAVRQWAVQQCRAAGFEPDVRFQATDLIAHARLIAAGLAVGVLPDLVWTGGRDTVRLVDLPGSPVREIFAATRSSSRSNAAIAAVLDALTEALAAHTPR